MLRNSFCILFALTLAIMVPQRARAQSCTPSWTNPFPPAGINGIVQCLAVYDQDGTGGNDPLLYAGGAFTSAGGVTAKYAARWNGASWSALGSAELTGPIYDMVVFDDGNGPDLYATGNFVWAGMTHVNKIARWSGTAWSALGSGLSVGGTGYALVVHDEDGDEGPNPPALYLGGYFNAVGGVTANRIARWAWDDGKGSWGWEAVGDGMDDFVRTLAVYDDDGAGPHLPALFAAGGFENAGGSAASRIAKWNGTSWSKLQMGTGNGVNNTAYSLVVHDDGSGEALFVGGAFTSAAGVTANHVAKWTGSTWSAVGSGTNGTVYGLTEFDVDEDGPAVPALYATGVFSTADGHNASKIAVWNGSSWSGLGSGIDSTGYAFAAFDSDDDGSDDRLGLYVGGNFSLAGGQSAGRLARWGCPPPGDPPTITGHPEGQTACAGTTAEFDVKVTGDPPFEYQWRQDGEDIPGANSDTYTIDPVTTDDAGVYDVVVTNDGGSTTSNGATLTVLVCGSGDLNCDGTVNLFDVEPFTLAVTDAPAYEAAYPECDIINGDCNLDTVVNLFDIDPFVVLMTR